MDSKLKWNNETNWNSKDIKFEKKNLTLEEQKIVENLARTTMLMNGFSNIDIDIAFLKENIGEKVKKKSGNPFKSTFKVNTIKDVVKHTYIDSIAYVFEEDDSCVDIKMCEILI